MTDKSGRKNRRSIELFKEATKYIPGGVNSPARAFKAVGECPRFIARGQGRWIYDVDGNRMLDYIGSWGPMILGHNHPVVINAVKEAVNNGLSFGAATEKEIDMAKLVCEMIPAVEMVRMVNSGTEATMSALRVARGYTGRNKIIKFEGCYHGHSDGLLVKAGSGLIAEGGVPDSEGVTSGTAGDTLTAAYNDINGVSKLFEANPGEIAAVIIEPIAANMGVVPPAPKFIQQIRDLTVAEGAVLIFDEVITGFRTASGGAQRALGVVPDLSTFGKIIGGGMPVGAYGGKKELMEMVSPIGGVYQAGTLSGNPVAMAAGMAQLKYLRDNPEVYTHIDGLGALLFEGIKAMVDDMKVPCTVNYVGSLGTLFFTEGPVVDFNSAGKADLNKYAAYFRHMLNKGFAIAPAQFEAMFISDAMTEDDIFATLAAIREFFETLK